MVHEKVGPVLRKTLNVIKCTVLAIFDQSGVTTTTKKSGVTTSVNTIDGHTLRVNVPLMSRPLPFAAGSHVSFGGVYMVVGPVAVMLAASPACKNRALHSPTRRLL
jgi:hypothetical protein